MKRADLQKESPEIALEKLEQFKKLFPEAVREGKVDVDALRLSLGEQVVFGDERYNLNWAGKTEAFRALQTPTTATLAPCPEESIDFDKTGNIFIEGENLEVLKVLQKSYYGKIKMIYIDPPYNTGSDSFIYPDRFQESKEDYLKRIEEKDEAGYLLKEGLFRKNSKENGHYHSNWLSMMYPRLFLARNLLRDDGVIFVSIDDNEVHNLRLAMNEIFGEENFVAEFVVVRSEGGGLAKQAVKGHDYSLAYARDLNKFTPLKRPKDIRGKIIEKAGIKYWLQEDWLRKEFGKYGNCHYEELEEYKGSEKKKEIDAGIKSGIYQLVKKSNGLHIIARLRSLEEDGSKFYTVLKHLNAAGVEDLEKVGMNLVFSYPKPISLIKEIVLGGTLFSKNEGDIILDFFAGSATTASAIYELNQEDGGNRRFICVQLAEKTEEGSEPFKAGFKNISEIAVERIKRVIKNIKTNDGKEGIDTGCKVFKLKKSNFKIWRGDVVDTPEDLEKQMDLLNDPVKPEALEQNLLWELLLKAGYDLNTTVEEKKLGRSRVFLAAGGEIAVLLGKTDEKCIQELVKLKPQKVICLDSAFEGNDQLKTNAALQMKDAGIAFKTV